jgi:hypothetical protein
MGWAMSSAATEGQPKGPSGSADRHFYEAGYRKGRVDAASEAGAVPVAHAEDWKPGFTAAYFDASVVPAGTGVYAAPPAPVEAGAETAIAAIQFALKADEGMAWLRCWNEGDFDACRREWPETPEECFIGADPLHPDTRATLNAAPSDALDAPECNGSHDAGQIGAGDPECTVCTGSAAQGDEQEPIPVRYYKAGGVTYAVYGSSSIDYVEHLHAALSRQPDTAAILYLLDRAEQVAEDGYQTTGDEYEMLRRAAAAVRASLQVQPEGT